MRNVTAELLPFSPSHTAAATEASLSAMAAESVAWEEHVQDKISTENVRVLRLCVASWLEGSGFSRALFVFGKQFVEAIASSLEATATRSHRS